MGTKKERKVRSKSIGERAKTAKSKTKQPNLSEQIAQKTKDRPNRAPKQQSKSLPKRDKSYAIQPVDFPNRFKLKRYMIKNKSQNKTKHGTTQNIYKKR